MALVFDARYPNSSGNSVQNVSSTSWSHTMSGSADGLLIAVMPYMVVGSPVSITTITFNSVAMTGPIARRTVDPMYSTVAGITEFYKLIAPSSGAQTLSVTFSTGGVYTNCGSLSFVGADQTTGTGNTNTAYGAAGTTGNVQDNGSPAVTSATGNMVIDCQLGSLSQMDWTGGQTQRFYGVVYDNATYQVQSASQSAAGAASVTMRWDWTAYNYQDGWSWSGVEILAAGGGGGARASLKTLLGAG